jgi:predicted dehydrogenase/nucleoside-diphosphate-sugar epimerase
MTSTAGGQGAGRIVRVGLIGCGKMGLQHVRAIGATPGAQVVGVADPAADRETLGTLLPSGARIVGDARELLEDIKPDVVHIVTPPSSHAALAREAILAGCHVYVEKPFTPTRAEAQAVLDLAAERGLKVCAGHQYLFEKPCLMALETLPAIGRLVHVESFFSFKTARRTITPVDQAKDILPHAVYPLVAQLRAASGRASSEAIALLGLDVRADGDIYAIVRLGDVTGLIVVTLNGRPVEQYQTLIGTNGALRADYITSSLIRLVGQGTGPGVLFTPYRRAWQTVTGANKGFYNLIFKRKTSYPGLLTILDRFYASVRDNTPSPLTPQSILDTVDLCERAGKALDAAERVAEDAAQLRLAAVEPTLPPLNPARPLVLLTGGTGLLGRTVTEELRHAGIPVRVIARRMPRYSSRVPGVEYVVADLARGLSADIMSGVGFVVHAAAETAGGKDDHQRNSIDATRQVFEAAARAGVRHNIHISSLAVLKPGHEVGGPLSESSPVDAGHLRRGPYVWGKAESENIVRDIAKGHGIEIKIIRPGPLVDYTAFQPPGRLGRELGPWFVAIGARKHALSVCDVGTCARVIRSYVEDFAAAPPLVNMVEAPPPARRELAARLLEQRPDLKVRWFPAWLLRTLSGPLKLVQRVALGSKEPVDVYAAFASERYITDVAHGVIQRAGPSAIHDSARGHERRAG